MTSLIRAFLDSLSGAVDPPKVPEARPVGCISCGFTFSQQSAYDVHIETIGGQVRCVPETRFEGSLLERVDGIWHLSGTVTR
jgi:hypothetical protein